MLHVSCSYMARMLELDLTHHGNVVKKEATCPLAFFLTELQPDARCGSRLRAGATGGQVRRDRGALRGLGGGTQRSGTTETRVLRPTWKLIENGQCKEDSLPQQFFFVFLLVGLLFFFFFFWGGDTRTWAGVWICIDVLFGEVCASFSE